ncbi:carboxypeptidase M32 [Tropicimonas isoalkanivorans]|uniref:Metal-dependent carboxypeptidase n=1 Tax=Tropicimonas isoalkanivorans TaxID=441112 RepID=A0A1I1D9C8_9RHOB|nr:carboxypeptidase M32 [Tropicimonas isoalkanivorans]SFB71619.1 carboxypeptidase Taq Metallo peptidase. MEROPS family M32 [Tropicimonas isoalkanivorans]
MSAYDDLMAHARETEALKQVLGRLGWDQETVMPRGAAAQRAEEMAAMEKVLHARRTDPRVGDWLNRAEPADEVQQAHVRELRREHERATRVPADLAAAIARTTSLAQGIWAETRAADDFAAFAPTLTEVLNLRRHEAAALAEGTDLYDALLDDYEPGETGASLSRIFDALRPRLVALRERILGSDRTPPKLSGRFDEATQMRLAADCARVFGYNFAHGRIDRAVHPFSSGQGLDSRITTRTDPENPFDCLYSTIHEVGHGSYEQNVDRAYLLTPLGTGASMGVHESQSRIYENQLARGRAFAGWLFAKLRETYGDIGVADADAFYAALNAVESGYIRTEADEVHYNLHILLRFDLERDLVRGALEVADLEEAWNSRFAADFGVAVDRPSNGVLQDVHWAVGLFGYFPTYTLGNVYAGCLFAAMQDGVPGWAAAMAEGDATPATGWLRERVQKHGSRYLPRDLVELASGAPISPEPLLSYLERKFGALYGL